jgi:hypothetical protein
VPVCFAALRVVALSGSRQGCAALRASLTQHAAPRARSRSDLLSEVASRLGWGDAWAYDGAATVYATTDLLQDTRFGETLQLPLRRPGAHVAHRLCTRSRRLARETLACSLRVLLTVHPARCCRPARR